MFDKHLSKSNVTYFEHLRWALFAGVRLIYSGFASIIHGINPRLFDGTAPKTIIDIYHSHLVNHPNDDYKEMIKEAKEKNDRLRN
jgi:hypothetical protein